MNETKNTKENGGCGSNDDESTSEEGGGNAAGGSKNESGNEVGGSTGDDALQSGPQGAGACSFPTVGIITVRARAHQDRTVREGEEVGGESRWGSILVSHYSNMLFIT